MSKNAEKVTEIASATRKLSPKLVAVGIAAAAAGAAFVLFKDKFTAGEKTPETPVNVDA